MASSKFRLAMLAPISWRVPPRHYGPWEEVVSLLTEGLVARGIDVTLFATADSLTRARLEAVAPRGYSEDPALDAKVWEGLHIGHCFERAAEFDLIHNHFDFLPLTYSGLVSTPLVTTIHGFSSRRILPVFRHYNETTHYVSISDADRAPELEYLATVHHGIAVDRFPLRLDTEGYLLFFGRIHPDKGCEEAIAVARELGKPLIIAGIVQDADYYETKIRPSLGGTTEYIGPVGAERRAAVLGRAAALLHLINFDEPFGLSVVEAMACGTPVIANRRGSMPEIVQDGVNGFLIDSLEDAARAVEKCERLDRAEVRASVVDRFSVGRMVDEYISVYEKIVHRPVGSRPRVPATRED